MRRIGCLVTSALLLFLVICGVPVSATIIYSTGFNTDTDGNGMADGWNAQPEALDYSLEPDNKVEGAYSQRVKPPPWKGIYSDTISGVSTGVTYYVSYWIYTGWNRSVQIWGDGKFDSYPVRTINTISQWVYCEDTVVASANANPAQIYVTAIHQDLPILIDDLKISDVSIPLPPSGTRIYTSGFNTDTNSDGIADGWSALSGSEGSTFWLETLRDEVREGAASQSCFPVPYKGIVSDPISGVLPGQTYTIKYWMTMRRGTTLEIWGDGKLNSYYKAMSPASGWYYMEDLVVASSGLEPTYIAIDGLPYSTPGLGAGFTVDYLTIEAGDTRAGTGTLTGQIQLLDFQGDISLAPVRVETFPHEAGGTLWIDLFTLGSNPGTYNLVGPIVPGTYDIVFSAGECLTNTMTNVVLGSGVNTVNAQMTNGDVNGSNAVNGTDLNILLNNMDEVGASLP